jgi:cellulose synthase/poly-beta-1,6-N-acetylglucosamine synthase-like glycosyltransferase
VIVAWVLWGLLATSAILFGWMFLGYPLVLGLISRFGAREVARRPWTPAVSVIVCTYNEANTIARRIENLLASDYPSEQMEILIVDSNSPDGTAEVARSVIERNPGHRIHLVQEDARHGKVSAINLGLGAACGEIVILTDGPTIFWPDTIRLVVQNLADPAVGAATGEFVKYENEGVTAAQETEWVVFSYRKLLRRLESTVDSTTWLSGELSVFRRSLVPAIPASVIIDDAYLAMAVRAQGSRVVADERARYAEKRPAVYSETIKIKKKSVVGGVQEMVRFRRILFNPKYGLYGMLILPARLMHFYLNPFIFLLFVVSSLGLAIHYGGIVPVAVAVGAMLGAALVLRLYRRGALLRPILAFLLMEWIIVVGIAQYMTGHYGAAWEQVTTTRT